jgi:hypothetical protein
MQPKRQTKTSAAHVKSVFNNHGGMRMTNMGSTLLEKGKKHAFLKKNCANPSH